MNSDSKELKEELSLFGFEEFRDPAYYVCDLTLIQDGLPELEWLTETPPYDTWHDDGVTKFARNWDDVMSSLIGDNEPGELTSQVVERAFERFMTSGQFGKANTFAHRVRQLEFGNEDHWSSYELLSGLAYIRLGLAEATLLPFSTIDEESGEVVHKSRMEPEHFLDVYNMAMALAEEYPDELAPYLEYADSLHMEMLRHYPYIDEYTHVMWKFWGSDPKDPRKQSIYERIQARDETWREQVADVFTSHVRTLMRQSGFYRASVLINFGRATELVRADLVKDEFLRVYDQFNLSVDLPEHLQAVNQMFVPYEYPRLTNLKHMVSELWQGDPVLRSDLDATMARREIETIQTIMSKPEDVDQGMTTLLKKEITSLARDLPDDDSQKKHLLEADIQKRVESLAQNAFGAGATMIDRLIEELFIDQQEAIIDIDALAICLDRIESAVINHIKLNEITDYTLEKMIGYISPFARLGQDYIDLYISDDFISAAHSVVYAGVQHYQDDERADYYKQMHEKLEQGLMELFEFYWDRHEEYYT